VFFVKTVFKAIKARRKSIPPFLHRL